MKVGADILAQSLASHGVREIFGQSIPSKLFLHGRRWGIRQLTYRTENAGAAMADAYARASDRVGVVAAQNGPAATLLVPGLAEALKASIPVVAIVQDVSISARDRNAFQELDHIGLFTPVSRWVRRCERADRLEDYVAMAFAAAASGHPGPAVLLVPVDVMDEAVPDPALPRTASLGRYPLDRTAPDPSRVTVAAEWLATARKPIVIAGGGSHRSHAYDALARLQALGFPVATTVMGKGAVDETHPLSAGVVGYSMGPRSRSEGMRPLITEADVVVLVGNRTNQNGTDSWQLYPNEAKYIHIDVDGDEIGRNYEALRLVGDAKLTLEALTDRLDSEMPAHPMWLPTAESVISGARDHWKNQMERWVDLNATPIRPERVMADLDAALTADTCVVADASYSSIWVANFLTARKAGPNFLTPRGLAGLGWGLPFSIGAKAANPEKTVHCVTGDGGFGHVWAELETAVRLGLPVVVTVLNNQLLGYQKHSEQVLHGAYTDACELIPVDHAAIARACGAHGVRITDPSQYAEELKASLERPSVTVLDVLVDESAFPPVTAYSGSRELAEQFW
jgi:acetolactate synthase-1/2/3 large subunit